MYLAPCKVSPHPHVSLFFSRYMTLLNTVANLGSKWSSQAFRYCTDKADKYVKNWGIFKGLEDTVKNMITSLPLVSDLAHPSMRERHWKQLMRATGKNFTMDDSFALGDLLELGLHAYVEEVADIVDRAQKELIIEKQLQKMEEVWNELKLDFVPYGETDVQLIQLPEELVEALDEGQVQLQSLGGSKYVAGNQSFQDQVNVLRLCHRVAAQARRG